MEFGFQRINYSVSEQPRLRDVSVCVMVNNGTFERGIEITFNIIDVTAQSTYIINAALLVRGGGRQVKGK